MCSHMLSPSHCVFSVHPKIDFVHGMRAKWCDTQPTLTSLKKPELQSFSRFFFDSSSSASLFFTCRKKPRRFSLRISVCIASFMILFFFLGRFFRVGGRTTWWVDWVGGRSPRPYGIHIPRARTGEGRFFFKDLESGEWSSRKIFEIDWFFRKWRNGEIDKWSKNCYLTVGKKINWRNGDKSKFFHLIVSKKR